VNEWQQGLGEEGKYTVFPIAKNKILVRFENIGDKFDNSEGKFDDNSIEVDIEAFA